MNGVFARVIEIKVEVACLTKPHQEAREDFVSALPSAIVAEKMQSEFGKYVGQNETRGIMFAELSKETNFVC